MVLDTNTGICVKESRTFDTWSSPTGWGGPHVYFQDLVNYLNSLPNGALIMLAIADEGGFINPNTIPHTPWNDSYVTNAYQTLEALGSTMIRNVDYRGGWAMIAVKGQGKLAENYSAPNTLVTIQAEPSLTLNPNYGLRTSRDFPTPQTTRVSETVVTDPINTSVTDHTLLQKQIPTQRSSYLNPLSRLTLLSLQYFPIDFTRTDTSDLKKRTAKAGFSLNLMNFGKSKKMQAKNRALPSRSLLRGYARLSSEGGKGKR